MLDHPGTINMLNAKRPTIMMYIANTHLRISLGIAWSSMFDHCHIMIVNDFSQKLTMRQFDHGCRWLRPNAGFDLGQYKVKLDQPQH